MDQILGVPEANQQQFKLLSKRMNEALISIPKLREQAEKALYVSQNEPDVQKSAMHHTRFASKLDEISGLQRQYDSFRNTLTTYIGGQIES